MHSQEDVKRLIHINSRRLQLLKEQKAYKGVSVDPSVTMEIEDLEVELQQLEHQLEERAETKIVIGSKLPHFTPEELEGKIAQIAAILSIPPTEISLLRAYDGSIILHVMMPAEAADRLMALHEANDPAIQELGIQDVQIIRREFPEINAPDLFKQIEEVGARIGNLERELADAPHDPAPITPIPTNGASKKAAQAIAIGDTVQLNTGQTAEVIRLATLFGQSYADVFIQPNGPLQRLPLTDLRPLADPLAALSGGQTMPASLFAARLAALQLRAMLTQSGVLSAANFRVTPLPHQVLAVDFVLNQLRPRVLLADEVGLGKTIEAAMIYEELKLRGQAHRVIIITPAGLTPQWRDELAQKFGENFIVYDRTMVTALRQIHGQETNLWTLHDQVITSLDFVKPQRLRPGLSERERQRRDKHNRRVFQDIVEAGWDMAIFDEAHKLSKQADGSETARYRVGEGLAQAVPIFLLLSATPHQGDPARFLHLLNLVDPYGFNQVTDLRPDRISSVIWRTRKRAAVDAQGRRLFKQRLTDIYPVDRSGPEHALEQQLYDEVTDYVRDNYNRAMGRGDRAFGFLMLLFQRMVTSSTAAIFDSLSKRLDKLQALQASLGREREAGKLRNGDDSPLSKLSFDEEAAADDDTQAVLDDLMSAPGAVNKVELQREIALLERLLDLARQAKGGSDAKLVALLNIIDEVRRRERNPQTKFLIFTEFVATQQAITQTLANMGYQVETINGRQKLEERIAARQAFADKAQFLVSTDAGGEGINLQFCHVMINYDLPWNPMKLEQRIGRLDRIGQSRDVVVLNLLIQDTVEQRVREVLEIKLDLIRRQYGDDKLADILSTLQDEFHFDRLYMDALLKRQAEAAELERLAQQIYQRAQEILDQDELLLPQTQAEVEQYRQRLVEVSQTRVKAMLAGYLAAHGESLNEYSRRSGIYYFDLPHVQEIDGAKTRYSNVVFDREQAVADDGLTYLHLNHPAVQEILSHLANGQDQAAAQLRLRPGTLPAALTLSPGPLAWAIYRLRMTNHDDINRQELISVIIDSTGQSQPRLAQALLNLTPDQVETAFIQASTFNLQPLAALAEAQAANIFTETQLTHAEKLAQQREKIQRYYQQQEIAVSQIAIENIRQAKLRELLDRRHADLSALDRRRTLVPELELVGVAVVEG
jgi:hypothetical protein